MLLACDIGNSKIKASLFNGNKIEKLYSFDTVEQLSEIYSHQTIANTGISSVVPRKSKQLISILEAKMSLYHLISINSRLNLKLNYKTPAEVYFNL